MNKPTRKVKPYPETPPDLPIDMVEDEHPEPQLTAIDYIIILWVLAMVAWFVWEAVI